MDIELREIDSVKPYERNPRLNDDAVDAIAASLKEFGFRQPIVVDAHGVIIAGHSRLLAAKKLGLQKIPVHVVTDLTPERGAFVAYQQRLPVGNTPDGIACRRFFLSPAEIVSTIPFPIHRFHQAGSFGSRTLHPGRLAEQTLPGRA